MERINIAELLKECPKGMELDCTMYDNVVLELVENVKEDTYPIKLKTKTGTPISVTEYGCYDMCADAKCVIFPKGKTTWEGFQRPFKDGDILYCNANDDGEDKDMFKYIFIFDKIVDGRFYYSHCHLFGSEFYDTKTNLVHDYSVRFATKEEKQKLFQSIKANGYRWNAETTTLEKLIEPKFKVGDRIREKDDKVATFTISDIDDSCYYCGEYVICNICDQDNWKLVPNKFDITTLTPFESKVLVRAADNQFWRPAIWGVKQEGWDFYCVLGGEMWEQCIPYEGNEYLLGKTDDCGEYFKIWES